MNEKSRKPAQTVAELASARQHPKKWPTIMERAVEGKFKAPPVENFAWLPVGTTENPRLEKAAQMMVL